MEIRERPPPILKTSMVGSLGGDVGGLRAPTTCVKDVDGGPPDPCGGSSLYPRSEKCVVTCMESIDKSNSAHRSHSLCTWSCYVL
jgi:hypothetical protein